MASEYYRRILTEAEVSSDRLNTALAQQGNSPEETQRVILGIADSFFNVMDTENPYKIRVHEEGTAKVFSNHDLETPDRAKIAALVPLISEQSSMVAQATLELFIPRVVLSAALGKNVGIGYSYDRIGYKQPRYFEVTINRTPVFSR